MRLILLFAILTISACKTDNKQSEISSLYDEVMFIHDEVMPETTTIHKLKKQLRSKDTKDSIVLSLISDLENADEMMMSWMAEFGKYKEMTNETDSVKIEYLKEEKIKIERVSEAMKTTIIEAENYISQVK